MGLWAFLKRMKRQADARGGPEITLGRRCCGDCARCAEVREAGAPDTAPRPGAPTCPGGEERQARHD